MLVRYLGERERERDTLVVVLGRKDGGGGGGGDGWTDVGEVDGRKKCEA